MSFEEDSAKFSEYAGKIMELARTSASFKMKFLSNAITFLQLQESQYNLAVDGEFIYYNPLYVIDKYKEDANYLDYAFLHMTVHCLFQHLFMRKQVDHKLWNAACDIYAFYIIDSANDPKLLHSNTLRLAEEKDILEKACSSIKVLTPEHLVTWLDENPEILDKIIHSGLFLVDSHDVWYAENSQSRSNGQQSNKRKKKRKKNKNKQKQEQSQNNEQEKQDEDKNQEQDPEVQDQDEDDQDNQDQDQENQQNSNKNQQKKQNRSNSDEDEENDQNDSEDNEDEEENSEDSDSEENDDNDDQSSAESSENDGDNEDNPEDGDEDGDGEDSNSDGEDENDEDDGDGDGDGDGEDEEDDSASSSQMSRQDLAEKWKNMAQRAQTSLDTGFMKGDGTGSALAGLQQVTKESISYEEFLRKFSVLTEQIVVNLDEFDYSFYTYGLQLYGNVPLIEPLEYKDAKRIHDFVIAIDTSGSTFGPLVQKFLAKTFNILSEQNSFDSRVCIHIIQCDTAIRSDVRIENLKDLEEYMRNFQIRGGGGTDFRPVFSYVEELIAAKEFTDLRGLLYFTDGYGDFPRMPPQYETAFTFIGDDHCPLSAVPDWAITIELDKDEFKEVV